MLPPRATCHRWTTAPGRATPRGASPGCPCRRLAVPAESTSSTPPLQLRLLDQAFILMGEQVRMDLTDRIHGDGNHDQQAGAAEIERQGVFRDQDLRQQADKGQVGRSEEHTSELQSLMRISYAV